MRKDPSGQRQKRLLSPHRERGKSKAFGFRLEKLIKHITDASGLSEA